MSILLPNYIFLTGVPGSRWSGISQALESMPGMNISDRNSEREYLHGSYTGHKGAYFGRGMEFDAILDTDYINTAWSSQEGCKIVKSHDWAYQLDSIKKIKDAWIMLVYRPDMSSYAWWREVGGFDIKYPCYAAYKDNVTMLKEITVQNKAILEFGRINKCKWEYFTSGWIKTNFCAEVDVTKVWPDILVTLIKT
jgi:hypothetical protein